MNATGYKKWIIVALMLLGLVKIMMYQFKPYFEDPDAVAPSVVVEELNHAPEKFCKVDAECDPVPKSCRRCHCPDEITLQELRDNPVVCQLNNDQHMYCDVVCKVQAKCVNGRCQGGEPRNISIPSQ